MFRTLTIISLQKWALDIAPLLGAHSSQLLQNSAEQILNKTKDILRDVLEDNSLSYSNFYNNIDISFDQSWGIRINADTNKIPHFKYLDQGFQPYDMKNGILNSKSAKISKDGSRYAVVPLKEKNGDVKFRAVSDKSRTESWWHPGYDGRHILDKTIDRTNRMVRRELKDSFSEMLGV